MASAMSSIEGSLDRWGCGSYCGQVRIASRGRYSAEGSEMTKTIDESQVPGQIEALLDFVKTGNQTVIVQANGVNTVALVPAATLPSIEETRKVLRRQEALRQLREARARGLAEHGSLSAEDASALADEIISEAFQSIRQRRAKKPAPQSA